MGHNTFGHEFTVTTFGESHGEALGVVIDGLESGFAIDFDKVQQQLDRRRPGGNSLGTKRNEADTLHVLSGIYQGKSTGTPLAIIFNNTNQQSGDYADLEKAYRPGHADYTFDKKWGIRDPRGGGRSSGRETVARVAAGAIARQLLEKRGVTMQAGVVQIGSVVAQSRDWKNAGGSLCCPDKEAATLMESEIEHARLAGDSVGGIIECNVWGLPAGLGEPVFDKLDALLAQAMLSIGAVKGVEFGEGFHAATLRGSQNNDLMQGGTFLSNHAGGILGGISNGNTLVLRAAFKPTPSISIPEQTMDTDGNDISLTIKGRHDPCICPRAVVVVESMVAITLLDAWYCQFGRN